MLNFVTIDICGFGDIMVLNFHVIEESCDFMGGTPSWLVITLPRLIAIATVVVEI